MAKDLTVTLDDRPGTLATLGETLGKAGVNIDGIAGFPCEGKGLIHILVEDAAGATSALKGAGIAVSGERDVLVVELEDKPGALGEVCRRVADAGVNIELTYLTTNTRVVLGVSDLEKAKGAI